MGEALPPAGFERVYVENDWYDGPRAGLANVDGVPHYFQTTHDYAHPDAPDDEYFAWPATQATLALEQEQWRIFTSWNDRYEARTATGESHPGHGGVDRRYDELQTTLTPSRTPPDDARILIGEWKFLERDVRYHADGPCYVFSWRSSR
jgi:hypothetical protein